MEWWVGESSDGQRRAKSDEDTLHSVEHYGVMSGQDQWPVTGDEEQRAMKTHSTVLNTMECKARVAASNKDTEI